MKRMQSKEDIIKDQYMKTLTCFLQDSTLYDCLSINNQVTVIDQSFSLYDVFNVFIDTHIDEVLFWNPDVAYYDGVFTQTDLIRIILKCYQNILNGVPNVWGNSKIQVQPIMEEEDEDRATPVHKNQLIGQEQINKLLIDLQTISVRDWFNSYGESLHQSSLVQADMADNLNDAMKKILKQGVTRIVVIDTESRIIVGILQQKDILAFLVKGFSQYFHLQLSQKSHRIEVHHENNPQSEQHELEINYFSDRILQLNDKLPFDTNVYDVFYKLIYVFKRNAIPIVDNNNKYLGLIDRRDFLFILKYQVFDMLNRPALDLLNFIKIEKKKFAGFCICNKELFQMKQTLKEVLANSNQVVENLLLSSRGSLVCLNENQEPIATLQMSDLFKICLDDVELE
ncbi:unnamed protein product (macronuclear) [Paramecium tetraurelia]|uniref:CBS domain-containing protein n=1 Tax=Paramecium tetraurelia TaxID=5888 RepID=A0E6N4_PARTE|nr:uncharacterized protein GSPATT00003816001 [Paramecium tetraurelia]CAK90951.1 unnamed protein product [Paramecium tetraurelia]|eukprot:XP_001458348.1 hypothetical protein (macronuclear) [Paramecium tetraurelia strain d4-2]